MFVDLVEVYNKVKSFNYELICTKSLGTKKK